jgi:hypothetical protein
MNPSISDQIIELIVGGLNELKGVWTHAQERSVVLDSRPLDLPLPADAIVYLRPQKNGLIVISAMDQRVLKLFFHPTFNELLVSETQTLISLAKHQELKTSHYISHGTTSAQGQWLLTTYCSNDKSFKLEERPTEVVYRALEEEIFPLITPFYLRAGFQKITLDTWLSSAEERCRNHPSKTKILTLIEAIKRDRAFDPNIELVQSMIHADLNENNILRGHAGLALIDWENRLPGLVLIDAFDIFARHLQKLTIEKRLLFLALKLGKFFSPSFMAFGKSFKNWQLQEFNCEMKPGTERLHFLIYKL